MRFLAIFSLLTFTLLSGAIVTAQTPDGETPANEGVCDELAGLTPGLYGLCVAYCEAHDADLTAPGDVSDEIDTPNRKILENYRKKMRPGDPDMPCVQKPCPCWTAEELASIDGILNTNVPLIDFRCTAASQTHFAIEFGLEDSPSQAFEQRLAMIDVARNQCRYRDLVFDESGNEVPPYIERIFQTTEEETSVCREDILAHCATLGF